LSKIREQNVEYILKAKQILNIYEGTTEDIEITFPEMAYMDDINFIANDLMFLEKILGMADEFYDLNDIQINKEKSELLLRSSSQNFNERITIKFGQHEIKIIPTPKDQSIRILGVWFNAYGSRSFVVNQAMDEIKNVCSILPRKE
jgi:hypothetical protein